jgi:hypothetical protein
VLEIRPGKEESIEQREGKSVVVRQMAVCELVDLHRSTTWIQKEG